jgi:hypothetical protein
MQKLNSSLFVTTPDSPVGTIFSPDMAAPFMIKTHLRPKDQTNVSIDELLLLA